MFKAELDTKQFEHALNEYMKFSKRNVAEIINTKCYFIARNATLTTDNSNRAKIENELNAPSKVNPDAPLAAILVNHKRKVKGQKGLYGNAMKSAVKQLINQRIRSINFLRSGWIPAINILKAKLNSKLMRGSPPMDNKAKIFGSPKGSATPANANNEKTFGEIENRIQGGLTPSSAAHDKLIQGLQRAIAREISSMRDYIETKINEEIKKFNK